MIGIGITERNRPEVFREAYAKIKEFAPKDAKIIVVDDASDVPLKEATYRFDINVGIAKAKNKCLELLEDCDHIFLFDSDTYPLKKDWWKPYVESPEPHLMYLFTDFKNRHALNDSKEIYRDSKLWAVSHPRGCMLYIERKVLDVVGGMDIRYGKWGHEHVDWSNRIYNVGLTSFRFADLVGSSELIYSGDEYEDVQTTVDYAKRRELLMRSNSLFKASFTSTEYIEYREQKNDISGQHNIILTSYLTKQLDTQRGTIWDTDVTEGVAALAASCKKTDCDLVVLVDTDKKRELTTPYQRILVESVVNPYFQRWLSQFQYLRDHPEIDNVFCVDATDVTILKNPFLYTEPGKIYCGDEPSLLANTWMLNHGKDEPIRLFLLRHRTMPLLNSGVIGGSREDVMRICRDIAMLYFDNGRKFPNEMGSFNYILRTKYNDRLVYGRNVTTVFKTFDTQNDESWICHK